LPLFPLFSYTAVMSEGERTKEVGGGEIYGTGDVVELPLEAIRPSSIQPRLEEDAEQIQDLVASMREHGLIHPILVRPVEDGTTISMSSALGRSTARSRPLGSGPSWFWGRYGRRRSGVAWRVR